MCAITSFEPILLASFFISSDIVIPKLYASELTLLDFPACVICYIIFYVYNNDSRFSFAFFSIDDYVYASLTGADLAGLAGGDFLVTFADLGLLALAASTAFIFAFMLALRSAADFPA